MAEQTDNVDLDEHQNSNEYDESEHYGERHEQEQQNRDLKHEQVVNAVQHPASLVFYRKGFDECLRPIKAHRDFDIGRKHVQEAFGIEDMTISSHHLHFHCVIYGEGEDEVGPAVAPLVYVRVLSSKPVYLSPSDSNNLSDIRTLCRDSGDILLNDGDLLQLTPTTSIEYEANVSVVSGLDSIRCQEIERLSRHFSVQDRVLGSGGHASVLVAIKQSTKQQMACKVVRVPREFHVDLSLSPQELAHAQHLEQRFRKQRRDMAREYEVLQALSHPNIISLDKVYCTTHSIYIFQELITGGDLLTSVDRTGKMSEPEAAVITRQILKAVNYLHDHNIVHRDIKPENVLMTSWRPGARVVLTDFGQARKIVDVKDASKTSAVFRMQTLVGTYGYTAPEVFIHMKQKQDRGKAEGYSKAIDIWSVGCVSALLLSGEPVPFDSDSNQRRHDQHKYSQAQASTKLWDLGFIDMSAKWGGVGRKAKDFVRACLNVNEDQRLTAEQALQHPWFTHKHYAAELEAEYQRAIQDWKPRSTDGQLVEMIDTSDIRDTETVSPHFADKTQVTTGKVTMGKAPYYNHHHHLNNKRSASQAFGGRPGSYTELHASPVCVPNTPTRPLPYDYTAHLAPELQSTADGSMLSPPPQTTRVWQANPGLPQSGLNEHSPSRFSDKDTSGLGSGLHVDSQLSANPGQEQQYVEMTQYTGDLDLPYPPPQQMRV
ncbi:Cell division control protein 2 [Elasticomyces elasticus]|nr:Cell division control protein 2 [Elasticomyces elasticus]